MGHTSPGLRRGVLFGTAVHSLNFGLALRVPASRVRCTSCSLHIWTVLTAHSGRGLLVEVEVEVECGAGTVAKCSRCTTFERTGGANARRWTYDGITKVAGLSFLTVFIDPEFAED